MNERGIHEGEDGHAGADAEGQGEDGGGGEAGTFLQLANGKASVVPEVLEEREAVLIAVIVFEGIDGAELGTAWRRASAGDIPRGLRRFGRRDAPQTLLASGPRGDRELRR